MNIKNYYDLTGKLQDSQSFYEKPAQNYFLKTLNFDDSQHIVEFGPGSGGFAQKLLADYLPQRTRYTGFDISSTMVELTSKRISHFGHRAKVYNEDIRKPLPLPANSIDIIFAHFVFDLFKAEDIKRVISSSAGYLKKDGLLCLSNITYGTKGTSRFIMKSWQSIHQLMPFIVGYCKPIDLKNYLSNEEGQNDEKIFNSFGISVQTLKIRLH